MNKGHAKRANNTNNVHDGYTGQASTASIINVRVNMTSQWANFFIECVP